MLNIRFKDPRGIDFPYLLSMLPASFCVTTEHHRLPGQQDAARDATDIHPHGLAADGPKKARLVKSSDFGTLYRGDLWTVLGLPPTKFNLVPLMSALCACSITCLINMETTLNPHELRLWVISGYTDKSAPWCFARSRHVTFPSRLCEHVTLER